MNRLKKIVRKLLVDQEGAALVEYGLLVALIAVVAIATLEPLGVAISNLFSTVTAKL